MRALEGPRHGGYEITYQECEAYVDDLEQHMPITSPESPIPSPQPVTELPEVIEVPEIIEVIDGKDMQTVFSGLFRLLSSSKGLIVIVAIAAAAYLAYSDQIAAEQFIDLLLKLVAVYAGATAIEDAAEKVNI